MLDTIKAILSKVWVVLLAVAVAFLGIFISNKMKANSRVKAVKEKLDDARIKAHKAEAVAAHEKAKLAISKAKAIEQQKVEVKPSKDAEDAANKWNDAD